MAAEAAEAVPAGADGYLLFLIKKLTDISVSFFHILDFLIRYLAKSIS